MPPGTPPISNPIPADAAIPAVSLTYLFPIENKIKLLLIDISNHATFYHTIIQIQSLQRCIPRSFKFYFKYLPFLNQELSLRMTRKSKARLWRSDILSIVITYRKFSVRPFLVTVVYHTDIATAEDRAFVRVVSYSELSQVQGKLFTHVKGKDKAFH